MFQSGPEGWGSVLVNVVFGAWFGRVLLETGIAATLIRKTTELGGDKPAITCILLCIVTAAIFSSLFGAGVSWIWDSWTTMSLRIISER